MLYKETVKIKWHSKTKKWYEEKGYIYTKCGEVFEVKVEDLPPTTRTEIELICDYCLERGIETTFKRQNIDYLEGRRVIQKDACKKCTKYKKEESNIKKYGVPYPLMSEDVQQKAKETLINKYGVESTFQIEGMQERLRETFKEKYGTENPLGSEEIRKKAKKLC